MSEMGVLDLSGGFAAGPQARTAAMRSSRNWMAQFRNNPGLVRAAAIDSLDMTLVGAWPKADSRAAGSLSSGSLNEILCPKR